MHTGILVLLDIDICCAYAGYKYKHIFIRMNLL
jgi:hypothetical protein